MTEGAHLNNHHRDTLVKIFQHPTSHNIEWHDVLSLLQAVGTVEERHEDKYHVEIKGAHHVFNRPKHKDIDVQQVIDLRHALTDAGITPDAVN